MTRLSVAVLVNVSGRRRAAAERERRSRSVRARRRRRAEDPQRRRCRRRHRPGARRSRVGRSDSVRAAADAGGRRRRLDDRARHPGIGVPLDRAGRDLGDRRRRVRRVARCAAGCSSRPVELPTFDSTLAEELPSFEEHPMLDGTPAIAAPIRSAADLTREQMIEYVTTVAQENPDNIAKLVKLWLAE